MVFKRPRTFLDMIFKPRKGLITWIRRLKEGGSESVYLTEVLDEGNMMCDKGREEEASDEALEVRTAWILRSS
ncbi:hypothetical protein NPIL_682561 [Nephila pilipes]|uniref:Uncharacterized protein n=1 Tax=Nephila pilipes TaxID=299642 RepID=A0A8X6Q1L1_NEPPI|nr:hypothetical protein NPIL_682561 [Nephila pilipes]